MICILAGVFAGAGVCWFGMWAFLKGQRSMLQINAGGLPDELLPARPLSAPAAEQTAPPLSKQLRAMFGDRRERREEDAVERR